MKQKILNLIKQGVERPSQMGKLLGLEYPDANATVATYLSILIKEGEVIKIARGKYRPSKKKNSL